LAKANPSDAPISVPEKVDEWFRSLDHPLKAELQALREIILSADVAIGEHIKWNHPAFFYTGEMEPFDPKEYKRYLVISNLNSKDGGVLLVFWQGGRVNDTSGFLSGDYADGRRLARFHKMDQVIASKEALIKVIKAQLNLIIE
jgi:hypothetical protein